MTATAVPGLASLLSDEGWAYASLPPQEPGDLGRFHALFGRDSLITALQVLPAAHDMARETLRVLAARQGSRVDPATEEEPGKILHEWRPQAPAWLLDIGMPVRDGALLYYGSADATSWFLVVLATLNDAGLAHELEPAWRAAAGWLAAALDAGNGLVRYGPAERRGLVQQGWRDSPAPVTEHPDGGGILRPDGTEPTAPLADADCQAVAVAALDALTSLDPDGGWHERAAALRARVSGAGSQLGWLLWAQALDGDAATRAAERLSAPDVLTEHGLRTLSSDHSVFYPEGYHRGAVWPFDSWLGWGGLLAAGRRAEAERVRSGVLAALERLGRAPELYAVTRAGELQPIAVANRVQAWTVGARWALTHGWTGRR